MVIIKGSWKIESQDLQRFPPEKVSYEVHRAFLEELQRSKINPLNILREPKLNELGESEFHFGFEVSILSKEKLNQIQGALMMLAKSNPNIKDELRLIQEILYSQDKRDTP